MQQADIEMTNLPLIPESGRSSEHTDHADNPHVYGSMWEYIMSVMGVCVGYGAFWRFPYLIYKNGGGVFIIPYLIAMLLLGMPLFYLEIAIGQMFRASVPFAYKKIHPCLKIVGLGMLTATVHFATSYNIILTYCYRYMFTSFKNPLPFAGEKVTDSGYFHE
jgi:solute carrier family 6 (neurotransmitter transporter, amino acid/orphan) member 15/16/17/18/20